MKTKVDFSIEALPQCRRQITRRNELFLPPICRVSKNVDEVLKFGVNDRQDDQEADSLRQEDGNPDIITVVQH